MKCVKRLICKQFFQVSGLFGPQCLSYLLKRFTHLCRALYGDAMLVYHFGPPIWPPKIIKNIWRSLFLLKVFTLSFFTQKLAYMGINISSKTWNGYTAENQEERLIFQRDSIPILASRTVNTRKLTLLYFRNETCYGYGNLYKDLFFIYLQPNVNIEKPRYFDFTIDDVTVKTINRY